MPPLKGVAVGAGYFGQFQYDAWSRIPEVEIVALCDQDAARAEATARSFGVAAHFDDWRAMIDEHRPDFVDVITPPETHLEICSYAAERKLAIICQKPLAPTFEEAERLVRTVEEHGVPLVVHENFRFQPWHREIKQLLSSGLLGEVFHLSMRTRMGDGWQVDAYEARQPFFRRYPRLLVYETGVHFIDVLRFLLGEVSSVFASLRRLNPAIQGEDSGLLYLRFASGATAVWDASRYNEPEYEDPRYTFGELRLDAEKGHLSLSGDGRITIKLLGQPSYQHQYSHVQRGFAGDCVHALQRHFVAGMRGELPFENTGRDYLRNVRLVEACYESAATSLPVST